MKPLLLLLALLLPWTTLLAEPAATLWTGKCVNKTNDTSGQVKLILFEPGEPDARGVKRVAGYMSVTGWLIGGGEFEGTISKGDLVFKSHHLAPIQWKGSFGLDSIVGTYSIPAQGDLPAQAGEFDVDKVNRIGPVDEFRQNFMVVIESDLNGFEVGADGQAEFWPQVIFDSLHPVGTAASIQVADLEIEWQEGADRISPTGIRRYTSELVLYWSSPLQPRGITRLRTVHSAELGELVAFDIVSTNGTTKEDFKKTAKDVGISLGVAAGIAILKSLIESGGK
jgi:hypothetical protein